MAGKEAPKEDKKPESSSWVPRSNITCRYVINDWVVSAGQLKVLPVHVFCARIPKGEERMPMKHNKATKETFIVVLWSSSRRKHAKNSNFTKQYQGKTDKIVAAVVSIDRLR